MNRTLPKKLGISQKIAFKIYRILCFADLRILRWLRKTALRHILKLPLRGLVVEGSVIFTGIGNLKLGNNVSIHNWSFISADGGLCIGDNVAIGQRCPILTVEYGGAAYGEDSKLS